MFRNLINLLQAVAVVLIFLSLIAAVVYAGYMIALAAIVIGAILVLFAFFNEGS